MKINKNIFILIVTMIIGLFFIELFLRVFPGILGNDYKNIVLSRLNFKKQGIFELDPITRINFMKSDYKTVMYWNKYDWIHETDNRGFRNIKNMDHADILLLGDSFVYGFCMDYDNTFAGLLAKKNLSVYNLARPGDCSYQEMYLLKEYGLDLKPKVVFYFYFWNDKIDLYYYLNQNEMYDFIKKDFNDIVFQKRSDISSSKIYAPLKELYLFDMIKLIKEKQKTKKVSALYNQTLSKEYIKKSILYMDYLSKKNNISLIIVPILTNNKTYNEDMPFLKDIAYFNNIKIIETYFLVNSSLYLENDGHFNENGHKRMSEELYREIKK